MSGGFSFLAYRHLWRAFKLGQSEKHRQAENRTLVRDGKKIDTLWIAIRVGEVGDHASITSDRSCDFSDCRDGTLNQTCGEFMNRSNLLLWCEPARIDLLSDKHEHSRSASDADQVDIVYEYGACRQEWTLLDTQVQQRGEIDQGN